MILLVDLSYVYPADPDFMTVHRWVPYYVSYYKDYIRTLDEESLIYLEAILVGEDDLS